MKKLIYTLSFLFLCGVVSSIYAQAPGPASNAITLNPGLSSNPGVYNPGTQTALDGKTISNQEWFEGHATSCTVNSTCGSTNDSGKALTATAANVIFTMPNPGALGSAGQDFGYAGFSYTITTLGNIATISGCGTSGTSITIPYSTTIYTDGVNYKCVPYGSGDPNYNSSWVAQGAKSCSMTGTSLTPDAKNCSVFYSTLTAASTLNNPTGLQLFSQAVQFLTFKVKQGGSGSNTLSYGTFYNWPGGAPPILTTRFNAVDSFTCFTNPEVAAEGFCSSTLLDIKGGGVVTVSNGAANTGAGSSVQVPLTGYAGHPILVGVGVCDGAACGVSTVTISSITTSSGNSCSVVANTTQTGGFDVQIWLCQSGAVGTNLITVNCTGGSLGCTYLSVVANEALISGSCEKGNHSAGTAQNFNLATNGATTQNNEIIYSVAIRQVLPVTPGAGQSSLNAVVAANNTFVMADSYQIEAVPGAYTNNYITGSSQPYDMAIAGCF